MGISGVILPPLFRPKFRSGLESFESLRRWRAQCDQSDDVSLGMINRPSVEES